jgi:hypothetical protein
MISLRTQHYSIDCYNAFIEDLETDIRKDEHFHFLPYKSRFQSLDSDLQGLSKHLCESFKKDFTNLTTRFNRLKTFFEKKCVDELSCNLSGFAQKISERETSSLVADYSLINEGMKTYKLEISTLYSYLYKRQTKNINMLKRNFINLVGVINAQIKPLRLKVYDKTQQSCQPYAKRITFSQKAQSLSFSLFSSKIDDIEQDIALDSDCRFLTYRARIRVLLSTLCRKRMDVTKEYQEKINYLKSRVNQVKALLHRRCITTIERRLDALHRNSNRPSELSILADEIRVLAPHIFPMKDQFVQLQRKWERIALEVLLQYSSRLPPQPRPEPDPSLVIRPSYR